MWCHNVRPSRAPSSRAQRGILGFPVERRLPRPVRHGFLAALGRTAVASVAGAQKPDRDYTVLVASEAVDLITRITFGPNGAKVENTTKVGINPMDPDGPHGVGLAPDGKSYYVSTAHGVPYGYLWKIDAKTNEVLGNVELGNFPATL